MAKREGDNKVNNQNYKGQTVLITGATSGIGYELSQIFAMNGFDLVLVARTEKILENMKAELHKKYSVRTEFIVMDLSLPSAPQDIFNKLHEESVNIDILVNNAGFNEYGPFEITDLEKEMQMVQVNIGSLTALTKLFLPDMLARNCGRILNVGSTGSFAPGPFSAVYCATKAYVLSFSEAIAEELKGSGVTITALCPGPTQTGFARHANMEDARLFQGRVMKAKEVAEIGYHALMRGKTTVVAGCANRLMIGSLRFVPRKMVNKMSKNMMGSERFKADSARLGLSCGKNLSNK